MDSNLLNRCLLNKKAYRKGMTRILRPRICFLLILALVTLGLAVFYTIRFLPLKDLKLTVLTAILYVLAAFLAVGAAILASRSSLERAAVRPSSYWASTHSFSATTRGLCLFSSRSPFNP